MEQGRYAIDKIEVKSRYRHVKDAIAAFIRKQCRDGSQLPSEAQFAKTLGVSRNTVREAIRILEREGVVFSRHGVGTFVIKSGTGSNLTILIKAADFIRENGYRPGARNIRRRRVPATGQAATRLLCGPESELVRVEGVRTADGLPAIRVRDYFATQAVWDEAVECFRDETFFDCLMKNAQIAISHSNCDIHAEISDDELNRILRLDKPTALLKLEQTHFSTRGEPVMYSDSWFIGEKFNFTVVRRSL